MVLLNQGGLKLNRTHQFLVFADDVNILGGTYREEQSSFSSC